MGLPRAGISVVKSANSPMKKAAKKSRPPTLVTVPLRFALPDAGAVSIAGTFNDWDPAKNPLAKNGDGSWMTELRLPSGRYEYRLVVDGEWRDAPGLNEVVENPFGSRNAVLTVGAAV